MMFAGLAPEERTVTSDYTNCMLKMYFSVMMFAGSAPEERTVTSDCTNSTHSTSTLNSSTDYVRLQWTLANRSCLSTKP